MADVMPWRISESATTISTPWRISLSATTYSGVSKPRKGEGGDCGFARDIGRHRFFTDALTVANAWAFAGALAVAMDGDPYFAATL
ncbi:MAG: hypothetical protein NC418_05740 [Muribaculaceae bacterium]|nr:hypothetical protein [Muribaculaceae bacterium]